MRRRLRASTGARPAPPPGPVETRQEAPRYVVCAWCPGEPRRVFYGRRARQRWEEHFWQAHRVEVEP